MKVLRERPQCNDESSNVGHRTVEGRPDCVADGKHLGLVFVCPPRPEETPESVFAAARHDMNVEVRHALAYANIDRHQRAVGAEPGLYRRGQKRALAKTGDTPALS